LRRADDDALVGRLRVTAGERQWLTLAYQRSHADGVAARSPEDADAALQQTLEYWTGWSEACTYRGDYEGLVRRSALVLKLLTFSPTGAIVAAPTTSLPEDIGGVRNWDYRYTWLRDSSLVLSALQSIGYHAEAASFFEWLERVCVECRDRLQVMFTVQAGTELPEQVLDHLDGYRASRPVRVGNAAADQRQLDIFGAVLDAAHLHFTTTDRRPSPTGWQLFRDLAERAARRWREPDHGIWEVRGPQRHFLYSKLLCWVALDRAERIAMRHGLDGDTERWRATAAEIRDAILGAGYDDGLGAFTQALDHPVLDASALAIPLVGLLPATDPRVQSTVARIRERLSVNGLVYRYATDQANDGVAGGEATFALCTFWLVDNLALAGRPDEARQLFERITGYANDVGLLS
ncbi:MAG: glycoside hydrolase family 15 protein, partial [Dehalococcoidia bacterium]